MTTTSLPRVPEGLRDLMKVYTKEVLREKPADLYEFSAKFFNLIVVEKSHQVVRKYEPVQTYETIMKNRIRQQVPLSMVFNIIPETLTDLIKKFIKAVLREKPENIYIFAQEYFERLSKEKSGRIEYTKYSTYEKSLKDKENVAPVSKVTCECGRVLSAQSKDLGKAVSTETTKLETTTTDHTTLSNSISYVKSVVIIQRHFRRYLKQKKMGREKDKCNSVEYMTAIIIIQRQFRRVLAKRRVEKLKKSRPGQLSYVKFNAANYMKAVVVIQRHYRIYLKRKQEQNRLKIGPVSLATAAIIIQRAFRRMVAVRRARRTASVNADPGEELNDNVSETGSYTSVSTALLSTESTELGIANFEEKVHQNIIHEDEEVENNNVDASLEKEYFAEPIKGDDKSIEPRKSEILSGALIEGMVLINSLEREMDLKSDVSGTDAEMPVIEDKFTPSKISKQTGSPNEIAIKTTKNGKEIQQDYEESLATDAEKAFKTEIEDEFTAIKAGKKLDSETELKTKTMSTEQQDSALVTELKSTNSSIDLQQVIEADLETKKGSVDLEPEVKDDLKTINVLKDIEGDIKDTVKPAVGDLEDIALPNKIEGIESDDPKELLPKEIKDTQHKLEEDKTNEEEKTDNKQELVSKEIEETPHKLEDIKNNGKDKAILSKESIPTAKLTSSESHEITEKPIETEVTPQVSIEIELVDDIPEQDLPEPNVKSGNDLTDADSMEEKPSSMPTDEINSLKTVLTNQNKDVLEQETSKEVLHLQDAEKTEDIEKPTDIETQEKAISVDRNSTKKEENEGPFINREKRSLDDTESSLAGPQPEDKESEETFNKPNEEPSSSTEERKSIEVIETQSNVLDQDSLNKDENEAREKRSIEDKGVKSPKSSLDVQEPITTDDADSNINKIEQEENSGEKEQESIFKETIPEMDDKSKEEVTTKEDVTGLVDAETGEITVHKLEEITEPSNLEITSEQAPKADLIVHSENGEDKKSEVEAIPNVPGGSSNIESSELMDAKMDEGEIINHLDDAVGLLMEPKIEEEQNNIHINPEESTSSVEPVPVDPSGALEEPESLDEHQETMPLGLDISQTEDISPTVGIQRTKSDSIEEIKNQSDISNVEGNTDEATVQNTNKASEIAIIKASSVFGEDTSSTSMEAESERSKREVDDSMSKENTQKQIVEADTKAEDAVIEPTGKPSSDDAQKGTETDKEVPASAVNISTESSGILQKEQETKETNPLDPETFSVKNGKVMDDSTELGKDSSMPDDSEAPNTMDSKEIIINQKPESTDSKEKSMSSSLEKTPSMESFQNHEKRAEECTVADVALAIIPILEENKTISLNESEQEQIPKEGDETEETPISIPENRKNDEIDFKTKDDKSIPLLESSLSEDKTKDVSESLDETKPESDLEKETSVDSESAQQAEDEPSNRETKPQESETSQAEDSKQTFSLEDTITPSSNEKDLKSIPSHPEKNSSLLVSNQLIGTQNLPTNRNEIEKNTKKLSSANVRDKDIGTLASGRLVATPIAELQLKSFKAPNDDGAWYDIYVEPQLPSDKDLDNPPSAPPIPANQTDRVQVISSEVEPIVAAERVPSYYTPKEIVEPSVPKAKNSISFFVSFDSDDGKPKYKIPKKFQNQSKCDTLSDKKNDPEPENSEEDIEVIEVSEGDPEYQQMGGSKLQTIMELNENEQLNEANTEGSPLHAEATESPKDISNKEQSDLESVKRPEDLSGNSTTQHYESVYKTDILNITRSVQIIERAYRRFKNRRLQENNIHKRQNNAAKIIQKWVREFLRKKSSRVTADISRESQESLAARKIQRAYRRYVEKTKENDSEKEVISEERAEKEKRAALVIQKAFRAYSYRNLAESKKQSSERMEESKQNQAARKIQRAYKRYKKQDEKPKVIPAPDFEVSEEAITIKKTTEVNASPNSAVLNSDKVKQEEQILKPDSRPSSSSVEDLQGLTELQQHEAAGKIQRAYKRYIKQDKNPKVILAPEVSEEPITVIKTTQVNASPNMNISTDLDSDQLKEEEKIQEVSSRQSSSPVEELTKGNTNPNSTGLNADKFKDETIILKPNSRPDLSPVKDSPGNTELKHHQAAGKIQRAFRRYLKQSNDSVIKDVKLQESETAEKPLVNSSQSQSSSMDEGQDRTSAALIIQKAFRQYMERRKLETFDEISLDSITSSRITAIENSLCPTEDTPSDSLIQEEIPSEDATKISPKSEWFVGSTRIVPSQGVVEEPLELETEPDPAEITSKTELDTSTQVESVEIVDRSHGSLESKFTPGISSSKIDENQGNISKQDNAVSSGLAGLTEAPDAGAGSAEDQILLSQSELGGIFQTLDIASTQELVNDFLMNEIQFSSAQGPYPNGNQLQEVVEEPCIKRTASLVSLSDGETGNDSSKSEATGLDTLSADTIDKATVKLSKPEEVIEKMAQLRNSKSSERILSAEPSFDEPIVRPMSSLQEQASLDIEDGDIIVYNRLQRDETRESSAQSDSVVFGEAESDKILDTEMATEEESGRVHLMRHYTIAGDDPRGLFRSVTIDDGLNYAEMGEKDLDTSLGINSMNSFCLDDETSENIRKKMMAYSLSETDSDYFDPKKMSKEDFDIDTAMDAMGTSTETESTIVSAATKIQAGARGFLTRRRLRRASAGTKSSTMDTKASFGNDAISESLERFIEEEAAKKIQAAYRIHTRKRKGKTRRMEGISLESNLAARRQKLQRGDALRNDSTPDDENSSSTNGGQAQKQSKSEKRTKAVGEARSRAAMELKWLTMRQNSMPVQIDCEVFRVIPKHMRKRIKSAEASKRK